MTSLDQVRARVARDEGLPFADVLTEASIRDALNEHGVKYRDRVFSRRDLAKGWHGNRLDLTEERLRLPDPGALRELATWDSRELDRSVPHANHYWEWET